MLRSRTPRRLSETEHMGQSAGPLSLVEATRTPNPFGPGLGLFYSRYELSEVVRNGPRRNLVVPSEPLPDFGADLLLFP
jgi:hypothetical protein